MGGVSTYDFAKFAVKLHEIEIIWTSRRASKILLCRSTSSNLALLVRPKNLHPSPKVTEKTEVEYPSFNTYEVKRVMSASELITGGPRFNPH